MRILHVIGLLNQSSGGPLRGVLDLTCLLQGYGINGELLGYGPVNIPDNPVACELIHEIKNAGVLGHCCSHTLRGWCRNNLSRFDLVILHGLWRSDTWFVGKECIAAGIPYIVYPHGMLDLWPVRGQGVWKRLKKTVYWYWRDARLMRQATAVFFAAKRELENANRTFRLPAPLQMVVPPAGLGREEEVQSIPTGLRGEQGTRGKVALFLGRVDPKKRPDLLIDAWAMAHVPAPWRLVIAGPGESRYVERLRDRARRKGCETSIRFTGLVAGDEKRCLLRQAAWFLLPSYQENFGIAVVEAINFGCAVAVSDQVYVADEFPSGAEILPGSVDAWTRFMRERMVDEKWRNETADKVRTSVAHVLDEREIGRRWVTAIQECLGASQRAI